MEAKTGLTQHMLETTAAALRDKLALTGPAGSWCRAEITALYRLVDAVNVAMADRRTLYGSAVETASGE